MSVRSTGASAIAALIATGLSAIANAVPIAGEFSGIVSGVSSNNASVPGGIAAGATVTGFFQFANTGQSPWSTNPAIGESRYVSQSLGSFFRIEVGGLVWESAGIGLTVRNDSPLFGGDLLSLIYDSTLAFIDPALALTQVSFPGVPAGLPNSSFAIDMFDFLGPSTLLQSEAVPASAAEIDLLAVDSMNGSLFGNTDGQNSFYQIRFLVNSIAMRDVPGTTPVPEPDTLLLLAAGLVATLVARRRAGSKAR